MQVVPKFGPDGPAALPTARAEAEVSARERAIAKLIGAAPGTNQNQVSAEEVAAVSPETVNNHSVETPVSASEETPAPSEAVEAPAKTEETTPLSSQYAVLARKEKALRQQMAKFQADQRAFKEQSQRTSTPQASDTAAQELAALKARLASDPLGLMNEQGHTWDDLTQRALNQPSPNEIALQRKIAQMEAKLAQFDEYTTKAQKAVEDHQTSAYQTAINQLRVDTRNVVNADPEFETIKAEGRHNDVVELIEETFKQGFDENYPKGSIMPIEVAAKLVEDHLVEKALKLYKLNKIQKRLAPTPAASAQKQPAKAPPQQQQMKTLTNDVGSTRKLSSRERAILAFDGKLNK